jgi:hypothetical protein
MKNRLKFISFPHLLHLKLDCYSFGNFDEIARHAPHLKSVSLSLLIFRDFEHILPSSALTQLSLTIKRKYQCVSMRYSIHRIMT